MTSAITSTEAALCQIYSDVLGVDLVRPDDEFFDAGGDSVLALQVIARAREAGLALVVRDLFDHQSPRALAAVTGALTDPADEGATGAAGPPPRMLMSDDFEDTDLDDFADTEVGQQASDAELGWETLT